MPASSVSEDLSTRVCACRLDCLFITTWNECISLKIALCAKKGPFFYLEVVGVWLGWDLGVVPQGRVAPGVEVDLELCKVWLLSYFPAVSEQGEGTFGGGPLTLGVWTVVDRPPLATESLGRVFQMCAQGRVFLKGLQKFVKGEHHYVTVGLVSLCRGGGGGEDHVSRGKIKGTSILFPNCLGSGWGRKIIF